MTLLSCGPEDPKVADLAAQVQQLNPAVTDVGIPLSDHDI
jgi:hypothetical protein